MLFESPLDNSLDMYEKSRILLKLLFCFPMYHYYIHYTNILTQISRLRGQPANTTFQEGKFGQLATVIVSWSGSIKWREMKKRNISKFGRKATEADFSEKKYAIWQQ
jgi:hypothetical protein